MRAPELGREKPGDERLGANDEPDDRDGDALNAGRELVKRVGRGVIVPGLTTRPMLALP